jgi:phage tail-like protein
MSYYPPVAFHFKVEIGLDSLHENDVRFQEVSGLSRELGVEQVAEGGENRFEHRLPARGKFGNLVLKRGLLTESGVITWIKNAIENFEFKPADVLVTLLDEEHKPLASWSFVAAWPVKWSLGAFDAKKNEVVVETLELAYRYFTKVEK